MSKKKNNYPSASYLHSGLGQVGAHGQTLPHDNIRVVRLLEGLLQSFQLLGGKGRPAASLLSVLGAVAGLQDDVLKCTAVERKNKPRGTFNSGSLRRRGKGLTVTQHHQRLILTSQSFGQREGMHGRPVVGGVLGLLRRLLVEVIHGAEGVHGVQGVAVYPVVLHDLGESIRLVSSPFP